MTWGIFTSYSVIFLVCFITFLIFLVILLFVLMLQYWFCIQHESELTNFTFIVIITFDFQNTALLKNDTLFHLTRLNDDWCLERVPTGSYIPFLDWVSSIGCSCSWVQQNNRRKRLNTYRSALWLADLDGLPDLRPLSSAVGMAWHAECARIGEGFSAFGNVFVFKWADFGICFREFTQVKYVVDWLTYW